jgi:hypothetical protein
MSEVRVIVVEIFKRLSDSRDQVWAPTAETARDTTA